MGSKNKYHISKSGKPAPCHAGEKPCPVGGEHFGTKQEAQQHFEKLNQHKVFNFLKKPSWKKMLKTSVVVASVASAAFSLSACDTTTITKNVPVDFPSVSQSSSSSSVDNNSSNQSGSVVQQEQEAKTNAQEYLKKLGGLEVKGRAPKTGYSRDAFISNTQWTKVRTSILQRDLTNVEMSSGHVDSGNLTDPYTSKEINYTYGNKTSVDIDHVVALGDAWQMGAQYLSADTRQKIASDPDNLLAVDYSANRQKGESDAASWLPPNKSYRCVYVEKQINVKEKYQLWVTSAEKDAMVNVLNNC